MSRDDGLGFVLLTHPSARCYWAHSGYGLELMRALERLGPFERASVLSDPAAVQDLCEGGQAPVVRSLIQALAPEEQARVLGGLGAIAALSRNDEHADTLRLVAELPPPLRAAVLRGPGAVATLGRGASAASTTCELLCALEKPDRAVALASKGAVSVLAENGQTARVLAMIEELDEEQRVALLSAPGALKALAKNGHVAQVMALLWAMPATARAAILSAFGAVHALMTPGNSAEVQRLLVATPGHERAERSRLESLRNRLARATSGGPLIELVEALNQRIPGALSRLAAVAFVLPPFTPGDPIGRHYPSNAVQAFAEVEALRAVTCEDQVAAFTDRVLVECLVVNGQANPLFELIEALTPALQRRVTETPQVVEILLAEPGRDPRYRVAPDRLFTLLAHWEASDRAGTLVQSGAALLRNGAPEHLHQFLEWLGPLPAEQRTRVLAANGVLRTCAERGLIPAAIAWMESLEREQQDRILYAQFGLFHDAIEVEAAEEAGTKLAWIAALGEPERARILCEHSCVAMLATQGWAKTLYELIEGLAPRSQAAVLSSRPVAAVLARFGFAGAMIKLLDQLLPRRPQLVKAAGEVCAFIEAEQAEVVLTWLRDFDPDFAAQLLETPRVVPVLLNLGVGRPLVDCIGKLDAQTRIRILSSRHVVESLVQAGHAPSVILWMRALDEPQRAAILTSVATPIGLWDEPVHPRFIEPWRAGLAGEFREIDPGFER